MAEKGSQVDPAGKAGSGRLSDMVHESAGPSFAQSFPTPVLLTVLVTGVLYVLANYWQFPLLVGSWMHDPNWSHGFLIPLFSIYLLYSRREELLVTPRRTCLWGLVVMVLAILLQIVAYYPIQNTWFSQLGMIFLLFGLVLYLAGPKIMRLTWLPILYLILAVPIPKRLYEKVALPLQELAAKGSAITLRVFGATIEVSASHLRVLSVSKQWRELTVAEACSGVRSLMAFVALGVAMAYLTDRPLWQRVILVAATIPVAICCNILRVAITCTMFLLDEPQLGQDFMHEFMGMMMLIPAFGMLWLLSWVLRSLFVDAEDEHEDGERGASAEGGE